MVKRTLDIPRNIILPNGQLNEVELDRFFRQITNEINSLVAAGGGVDTSGTPVDNDYAKFTDADTIEGRSYAEVRSDINVEDGATADQTGAEIKAAYEGESNTNAFTDAEQAKLSGIEASADVTDATNVNAAGAVMESDVDAKGDIFVATADNTVTRLAVGTNDHVLTADSGEACGVKWAASGGGGSHASTHEDGGADEIDISGLAGMGIHVSGLGRGKCCLGCIEYLRVGVW
jgi:hypothetical protein